MVEPEGARGRDVGRDPGEEMPPALVKADDARSVARKPFGLQPLTEDADELADDLRCSRRHVEQMNLDGRLGPVPIRLGRRLVWVRAEVQAWLAAGAPDRVAWLSMRGGSP